MSTTHHLPLDRRTLHGHFSRDLAAVITVDRGDSVEFQALDSGWHWDLDREWLDHRHPQLDEGHALTGPVEIRGARAGHTLVVRIDQVRPRDWGITFAGEDAVVWRLGADTGTTADGGDATVSGRTSSAGIRPPATTVRWASSTSRSSRTWITNSCRRTPWPTQKMGRRHPRSGVCD